MVDARFCKKLRLAVFVASPRHVTFLIVRPKLQSVLNVSARRLDAETNVSYKSKQMDELGL